MRFLTVTCSCMCSIVQNPQFSVYGWSQSGDFQVWGPCGRCLIHACTPRPRSTAWRIRKLRSLWVFSSWRYAQKATLLRCTPWLKITVWVFRWFRRAGSGLDDEFVWGCGFTESLARHLPRRRFCSFPGFLWLLFRLLQSVGLIWPFRTSLLQDF